jgi:hypothetical protein
MLAKILSLPVSHSRTISSTLSLEASASNQSKSGIIVSEPSSEKRLCDIAFIYKLLKVFRLNQLIKDVFFSSSVSWAGSNGSIFILQPLFSSGS